MDGTPFKIGEREFLVPRLRVYTFECAWRASREAVALEQEALKLSETDPERVERILAAIEKYTGAILDVLREQYRDLTAEDLKRLLPFDVADIQAVLGGLLQAGGKKSSGEAVTP